MTRFSLPVAIWTKSRTTAGRARRPATQVRAGVDSQREHHECEHDQAEQREELAALERVLQERVQQDAEKLHRQQDGAGRLDG